MFRVSIILGMSLNEFALIKESLLERSFEIVFIIIYIEELLGMLWRVI